MAKRLFAAHYVQSISSLKAGGHHISQGKRGEVKTPLTNQVINHGENYSLWLEICRVHFAVQIAVLPFPGVKYSTQHRRTCSL